ncbi:hypothetical protein NTJ12_001659 [Flavobacterium psychrophilum]|nr:hypothetical protein [Flavobacterium psychrophilum]
MKKIVVLLTLFTLFSCNDGSDLGNKYYYLPDYEALDIGYAYGSIVYKSENKNHFNNVLIYSEIEKINYNDEYILAIQKPNKASMTKRIKDDLELWNNYYLESKKDSLVSLVLKKMRLTDIHNLVDDKKRNLNITADSIFKNEILYKKMFQNKNNY